MFFSTYKTNPIYDPQQWYIPNCEFCDLLHSYFPAQICSLSTNRQVVFDHLVAISSLLNISIHVVSILTRITFYMYVLRLSILISTGLCLTILKINPLTLFYTQQLAKQRICTHIVHIWSTKHVELSFATKPILYHKYQNKQRYCWS